MVSKQKPVGLSCLHTTNEPRALLCAVVLDHISYRLWRGMCSDLNWATHSEYERLSNAVAILRTFTAEKECRSSAQQAMYCLTLWYRVQWFCRSLQTVCPTRYGTRHFFNNSNTNENQLDDEELSSGYFQQDGATSHTSHASMSEIQSFFGDRVISKGLWPQRSPDLTPPDYF